MSEALSQWFEAQVVSGGPGPAWVVVDTGFAEKLETQHEVVVEVEARDLPPGPVKEVFTRELPKVGVTDHLDESGLVRVGTSVCGGDILVGRLRPPDGEVSTEEKRAERGEDTSVSAPSWMEGTVVESGLVGGKARVAIEWERPLAVGDRLVFGEGSVRTVVAIRDLEADLAFADPPEEPVMVAKVTLARDGVAARSIGPYSSSTCQPYRDRDSMGGQRVTKAQLRSLIGRGAMTTAAELVTMKSDDRHGRVLAYEALVKGESPTLSSKEGDGPEAARTFRAGLEALGFVIDTSTDPGDLGVRLLTSEEIRRRSWGEVDRPETLHYQTLVPERSGLFCARIFGPVDDFKCLCGKLGMSHHGKTCEDCGVEVTSSMVRRERFGHVDLARALLHPFFVKATARMLETTVDQILRWACTPDGDGTVVVTKLRELSADLPSGLVLEALPVLPAGLRPMVLLDDGRFATSDLNDLYRRVINRNTRVRRLVELEAPEIIIETEVAHLWEAVAYLFTGTTFVPAVTGPNGRKLVSLMEMADRQRTSELFEKTVDFSGAAAVVIVDDGTAGAVNLPRLVAQEIFRPRVYHHLIQGGSVTGLVEAKAAVDGDTPEAQRALEDVAGGHPFLVAGEEWVVSRRVSLWNEWAIGLDESTWRALGKPSQVSVHMPLTDSARKECEVLADELVSQEPSVSSGWVADVFSPGEDLISTLSRAALAGESAEVEDPLVRMSLGM
jgi:hypothetical protein